jgi:hypothetical protein
MGSDGKNEMIIRS